MRRFLWESVAIVCGQKPEDFQATTLQHRYYLHTFNSPQKWTTHLERELRFKIVTDRGDRRIPRSSQVHNRRPRYLFTSTDGQILSSPSYREAVKVNAKRRNQKRFNIVQTSRSSQAIGDR